MVQVCRGGIQAVMVTGSWERTASGRHRDSGAGWMGGEVSGGLCGGLEGHAKVLGGYNSVDKVE